MAKTIVATAKELKVVLITCVQNGKAVLIYGAPGCGKTTIATQVHKLYADYYTGGIYVWSTATRNAIDLGGLYRVVDGKTVRCPISEVPYDKPVFILVDELGDCSKAEQSGFYRLVNDKELGDKKLFPGSYVCCASNREDDGASAKPISTALKKRCCCVTLVADQESVLEYGYATNWNAITLGFIRAYPESVNDAFNADTIYGGSTPRSLEQLSDIENSGDMPTNPKIAEIIVVGFIDHDLGSKYMAFRNLKTPDAKLVFDNYKTAPVLDGCMQLAYHAQIVSQATVADLRSVVRYALLLGRVDGCSLASDLKLKFGKATVEKVAEWTDVVVKYAQLV